MEQSVMIHQVRWLGK